MPVWDQHRLISAAADQNATLFIANSLGSERPWLFVIGHGLSAAPDREELIAAAMIVMATDELRIFCVDGAEAPLGLRDLDVTDVDLDDLRRPRAPDPDLRSSFGAAVDLYSSTANHLGDEATGERLYEADLLRPKSSSKARTAVPILIIGAGILLLAAAFGLWLLTGENPSQLPGPQPASITGGNGSFLAGVLVTLIIAGATFAIMRWLGGRKPAARVPHTSSALFSAPARGTGIFISYSHRDSGIAHELAEEVERQGRSAWIFEQQMQGGATGWAAQVVKALRESRAVMLIGSSSAFGSDQVMREMYLAMDMRKPIVPLILDDAPMPDDFQYILAKFQRHPVEPPLGSLVTRALADC